MCNFCYLTKLFLNFQSSSKHNSKSELSNEVHIFAKHAYGMQHTPSTCIPLYLHAKLYDALPVYLSLLKTFCSRGLNVETLFFLSSIVLWYTVIPTMVQRLRFSINVQHLSHRFAFQRSPAVPAVKTLRELLYSCCVCYKCFFFPTYLHWTFSLSCCWGPHSSSHRRRGC